MGTLGGEALLLAEIYRERDRAIASQDYFTRRHIAEQLTQAARNPTRVRSSLKQLSKFYGIKREEMIKNRADAERKGEAGDFQRATYAAAAYDSAQAEIAQLLKDIPA